MGFGGVSWDRRAQFITVASQLAWLLLCFSHCLVYIVFEKRKKPFQI
jgi:hypothetical protein